MLRPVICAVLLHHALCLAQTGPMPPCGQEPIPPHAGVDVPPTVRFWTQSELGREWRPPACSGWTTPGFSTLITISGRFRHGDGAEGLLRHIGAVSQLTGVRYWSTTHQRWQTLIVSSHALAEPSPGYRRPDFMPDEVRAGQLLYLEQADNLSGLAVWRMRVMEATPDRIVFSVENVSVMRYLFVTLFHPGEMQSVYFLDREPDGVWRYYSMSRSGRDASRLASGVAHQASSINRAVAFFRALAGIPTDQEPPAAR